MVMAKGNNEQRVVDGQVLAQLEANLYMASCQVGLQAFMALKGQAAELMKAGHDPRRFKVELYPCAPAVAVKPGMNIVPAVMVPKGMKRGQ